MTGWLLIVLLLILGGILSTLGDRLGSKVGKARLSIFNLRPKRTAVLITVLTGSIISALSLALILLLRPQLRVGLFQLEAIQERIKSREKELKQLEQNLYAFRRGDVVISSGQTLATAKIRMSNETQIDKEIEKLLQIANYEAYRRVRPGERPDKRILLVLKGDIKRLEEIISKGGEWAIDIRSSSNILLGEKAVYAFPELRPNINIVESGEVIARTLIQIKGENDQFLSNQIKLLLASTSAEIKRRGSLRPLIKFDPNSVNRLANQLRQMDAGNVEIEAISVRKSDTTDSVAVSLRIRETKARDEN